MKKIISIAIFSALMAAPVFFTSCSNEDDLFQEDIGPEQPVSKSWVEPYHVQNGSVSEVKAYMTSNMKGYHLTNESENPASIQLVYSTGHGSEGILYSFTKNTGLLYSVINTEFLANKTIVLDYLNAHYTVVPGSDSSEPDAQYIYTNADKSAIITTQKVTNEYFNVSYSFAIK